MNAKLLIGVALLVIGGVLLWQGWQAKQSLGSQVSQVFTGNPSDQAVWYLAGGAVAAVAGLAMIVMQKRR